MEETGFNVALNGSLVLETQMNVDVQPLAGEMLIRKSKEMGTSLGNTVALWL